MWSMTANYIFLLSSRLNSSTPLDLVLYLAAHTIHKQMVKQRDSIERYSKLLDVSWHSSPCLNHKGVTCYIMLSLPSTQQWQRALIALHLSWYMRNMIGCLLISFWVTRVRCMMQLTSVSTSSKSSSMPKTTWREHRTTRTATLISTTGCRSIW